MTDLYAKTRVENSQSKIRGLVPFYYRLRSCDTNINQYQRVKLINNTLGVPSSLYTMNLGSLSAYKGGVRWNQMSDRPTPSVQRATATSSRPGGQTPGGVGCDIKHNSYDRYLNRLKGRSALREGVIGVAPPIYGGKTFKPNIITGCVCPV
jgi:hypothetical protein